MSDWLDLAAGFGQRQIRYTFTLIDGQTGENLGRIHPIRSSPPTLSHDSTSTISRRVQGIQLEPNDVALFRPLMDRVQIDMVVDGVGTYPLGRYLAADDIQTVSSGGNQRPLTLYDEMFIVDQPLEAGYDAQGKPVDVVILELLDGLNMREPRIESTHEVSTNSWGSGASRGSALNDLANLGGYFKPWFDHTNRLTFRAIVDPAKSVVDIDWDVKPRVIQDSITRKSEALDSPNRFIVVSNANSSTTSTAPMVGVYDVPATAPHSITARGFVVPKIVDVQVASASQAATYARTLGIQSTIAEVVECSTPVDPRHDSYQIVKFLGVHWLETAWSMTLVGNGEMTHTLRRAYPTASET